MSDFACHLARINDVGYGWVRLASNDIDPILYANEIGLDVIIVLDIRDAFREYYLAEAKMRRNLAYEAARRHIAQARARMNQAQAVLEELIQRLDPLGILKPAIDSARKAAKAAEDAFIVALDVANRMIANADREYEKFLLEALDLISRMDRRAFPAGWKGIWKRHIKERIDALKNNKAQVTRYQITNEPNHLYHNWALAQDLDLAAEVVEMGGRIARARHFQLYGSYPETMVNLFFRWCNTAELVLPRSYIIDDLSYVDKFQLSAPSIDTLLFDIYPLTWHVATLENGQPVLPCYINRYLDDYHDRWRDGSGQYKPVGIMETGWCTSPHMWLQALESSWPDLAEKIKEAGIPLNASDTAQVEFFRQILDCTQEYLQTKSWMRYLGVYEYSSTEEWYNNRFGLPCENYFGLNTKYGREKPAWKSVAARLSQMKGNARRKVGITYHV